MPLFWNCKIEDSNDVVVGAIDTDGRYYGLCLGCLASQVGGDTPPFDAVLTIIGTHELSAETIAEFVN